MTNPERVDRAEIRRHLALITTPGQVIEVRAVGATSGGDYRQRHIIAGYFGDHDKLTTAVANYITRTEGIYITLNEINEALLARACNRLVDRLRPTTGDADVLRRRVFYVDVDPVRPAQISATDTEHALALARVRQVSDYLQSMGALAPLLADSGNGGHVLCRTCATLTLAAGADLRAVAASPGHASTATTESYAEDAEMVKDNPARYLSGLL